MPGFFSPTTLEQIRAASDIVDVIGSALPLKRAGANFVALCPFHKEKSPSFNVSPNRQIFHCFGCQKGGDVFAFVKEYENLTFPEAVKRLADRAKIPLESEQGAGEQISRHLKDQLLQIHEQIAQRWHQCLLNEAAGQPAREYLDRRGVGTDAIRLFRLGAAPELWDDTVNWAVGKHHELEVVEKAGLVIRKSEGPDVPSGAPEFRAQTRNFYDRFRGRLMFPICDEQGRVIGFSGRILSADAKAAKYVNSPETPIFTKSKVFFGLDKSKRAILDAGRAIVCEGQLDLIACFMAGVQNIVAPQGTALTDQHARILKRYVDEVVLCFDSDAAGQNAAVRSQDHLLACGLAVRVAVVPAPHDPDSFIKEHGGQAFANLIQAAGGFFDYYLNRLCVINDAGSDKGRLAILRSMAEAVHKSGNMVLVDKYAQKTALRLGVSPESVRSEFKKAAPGRPAQAHAAPHEPVQVEVPSVPPNLQESWLLKLIFRHEEFAGWCVSRLDPEWIAHAQVRQLVARRLEMQREESWTSLGSFLEECDSSEMRNLVTAAVAEDRPLKNPAQQFADVATWLRNQHLDRQIQALIHRANQSGIGDDERDALLRRQPEIRQLKRQPIPPPA